MKCFVSPFHFPEITDSHWWPTLGNRKNSWKADASYCVKGLSFWFTVTCQCSQQNFGPVKCSKNFVLTLKSKRYNHSICDVMSFFDNLFLQKNELKWHMLYGSCLNTLQFKANKVVVRDNRTEEWIYICMQVGQSFWSILPKQTKTNKWMTRIKTVQILQNLNLEFHAKHILRVDAA